MTRKVTIGQAVAWPLLLPGNLACKAFGLERHEDLVRMLVNSLVWMSVGIVVVVLAT